jgi:hypothetical protein
LQGGEESIATQVDRSIERVALEAAIADEIVRQLEKDREATAKAQEGAILRCKADITTCEKQIDLLLDMRLNEQIGEAGSIRDTTKQPFCFHVCLLGFFRKFAQARVCGCQVGIEIGQ